VVRNNKEALVWLQLAAAQFDASAVFFLRSPVNQWIYDSTCNEQEERVSQLGAHVALYNACHCGQMSAWEELQRMAVEGDLVAMVYVIQELVRSENPFNRGDVDFDVGVAMEEKLLPWLRSEAEKNNIHALFGLGCCGSVSEETIKYLELAAEMGHAPSQHRLEKCRYFDSGNYLVQALAWVKRAAEQGFAQAQVAVGRFYREGIEGGGFPRDDEEAFKWFKLAADQGIREGQYEVGIAYVKGHEGGGVVRNNKEALVWLQLAAAQFDASAVFFLRCPVNQWIYDST
jgi:TPR repeat protein